MLAFQMQYLLYRLLVLCKLMFIANPVQKYLRQNLANCPLRVSDGESVVLAQICHKNSLSVMFAG